MKNHFLVLFGIILAFGCKPRNNGSSDTLASGDGFSTTSTTDQWKDLSPDQTYKVSESLFADVIHEMHIYMQAGTFNRVTRHKDDGNGDACKNGANFGHVEKIEFINHADGGKKTTIQDAGIKVRGNTSCGNYVKQYKIKLSETKKLFENENDPIKITDAAVKKRIADQTLYGLKTISLRWSQNDPTFLRDRISSEIFEDGDNIMRSQKLPGAAERGGSVYRVGFVKVTMHKRKGSGGYGNEFFGIFNIAEGIDKALYDMRWGKGAIDHSFQSNLAKGNFRKLPDSDDKLFVAYEPDIVDGEDFDDESPTQAKNARDYLTELTDSFAEAIDKNNPAKMNALLDIDSVVNYMVAANLTGHWDSLVGNSNNDFIYHNKNTGKWGIIVWDLDNTLGSIATNNSGFNEVWNARYNEFKSGGHNLLDPNSRPMFAAVMKHHAQKYQERYKEFLKRRYDVKALNQRIVKLRDMVVSFGQMNITAFDPAFEMLFSFKNHRWGHANCNLYHGGKKLVIGSDLKPQVNVDTRTPTCR